MVPNTETNASETATTSPKILHSYVRLKAKPSASLSVSRVKAEGKFGYSDVIVVFLNGLILPQAVWHPVITAIVNALQQTIEDAAVPEILAYDRYGQGKSDADPLDADPDKELGYGHGVMDVVEDLHQLLIQTFDITSAIPRRLMFVASSIGCAFARLYAEKYPGVVAGMVLLDSMMANQNYVDMFPDPASPDFDLGALPKGVTVEMLTEQRQKFRERFAPDVKNGESLDRRNLGHLLPHSHAPSLLGYGNRSPLVTVVGHDKEHFAQVSWEGDMKTPIVLTKHYTQPTWDAYNKGLLMISDQERVEGVLIAAGCGHFIPLDDPIFSAAKVVDMLQRLATE